MTDPHRRRMLAQPVRWLSLAALAPLSPWLAGCAGFGGPTVITLTEAEVSERVARRFPLQRRLLEVLEVQARDPVVKLLPERNRLDIRLQVDARDRLLGWQQSAPLNFDTALRWDSAERSVRLSQVVVRPASGALAQRLSRGLAERMLEDLSVYRLDDERDAQLRRLGLQPSAVTVTARGVEITLARPEGR